MQEGYGTNNEILNDSFTPSDDNGTVSKLNVNIVEKSFLPADFYLYKTILNVTLTADCVVGDKVLNTSDTTGATAGDVITLYEGSRIFQNIVASVALNTITLVSAIDYTYTSSATIDIGDWNMAVDGSVTPQVFSLKAPFEGSFNIKTVNVSMLDSTDMDDAKFGGIPQLTNGLVFRGVSSYQEKHFAVIVNNLGFWEIGFDIHYSDKAPAGQYGFRARRSIDNINGVMLKLIYDAEFQVIVSDDLSDLDLLAITINGYINE